MTIACLTDTNARFGVFKSHFSEWHRNFTNVIEHSKKYSGYKRKWADFGDFD